MKRFLVAASYWVIAAIASLAVSFIAATNTLNGFQ